MPERKKSGNLLKSPRNRFCWALSVLKTAFQEVEMARSNAEDFRVFSCFVLRLISPFRVIQR